MIESFYPEESESCRTTGCSCCSSELNTRIDKEEILKQARDNIRVAKKICEHYKVPFGKFCKDILTEKQCRKHRFWKKYSTQETCWKCDYWKKGDEK
jgi:hypothetical protein